MAANDGAFAREVVSALVELQTYGRALGQLPDSQEIVDSIEVTLGERLSREESFCEALLRALRVPERESLFQYYVDLMDNTIGARHRSREVRVGPRCRPSYGFALIVTMPIPIGHNVEKLEDRTALIDSLAHHLNLPREAVCIRPNVVTPEFFDPNFEWAQWLQFGTYFFDPTDVAALGDMTCELPASNSISAEFEKFLGEYPEAAGERRRACYILLVDLAASNGASYLETKLALEDWAENTSTLACRYCADGRWFQTEVTVRYAVPPFSALGLAQYLIEVEDCEDMLETARDRHEPSVLKSAIGYMYPVLADLSTNVTGIFVRVVTSQGKPLGYGYFVAQRPFLLAESLAGALGNWYVKVRYAPDVPISKAAAYAMQEEDAAQGAVGVPLHQPHLKLVRVRNLPA